MRLGVLLSTVRDRQTHSVSQILSSKLQGIPRAQYIFCQPFMDISFTVTVTVVLLELASSYSEVSLSSQHACAQSQIYTNSLCSFFSH